VVLCNRFTICWIAMEQVVRQNTFAWTNRSATLTGFRSTTRRLAERTGTPGLAINTVNGLHFCFAPNRRLMAAILFRIGGCLRPKIGSRTVPERFKDRAATNGSVLSARSLSPLRSSLPVPSRGNSGTRRKLSGDGMKIGESGR
jgi:hypothetical protein